MEIQVVLVLLGIKVLKETMAAQVQLVQLEILDQWGLLAPLENLELQVMKALLVLLDHLALVALKVPEVMLVPLVLLVHLA